MKVQFNSKDRVKCAFSHAEPDRIPIDYLYNPGIDQRLKAHYGLGGNDNEALMEILGVDFRNVEALFIGPQRFGSVKDRQIDE